MSDAGAVPAHRGALDPAERGTLDVKTRAIARIAELAALEVDGTVEHTSTLSRLTGGRTPRASVITYAGGARLVVDVSVGWPCDLVRVATRVRSRVQAETSRLAGLEVTRVDVRVGVAGSENDETETRRVR